MRSISTYLTLAAVFGLASSVHGNVLINDTWLDGIRTDPASPTYAENNGIVGTDADSDGNLESAWFRGGTGTVLAPVGAGGPLRATMGSSSGSFTTYFTPTATPVTLVNAGDTFKLTWVFTPTGVNANNTSQAFDLALALTPSASRLTAEGSPGSAAYLGYAMYMNMGVTLGNANPFQLRQWAVPGGANNLLSTSAAWTPEVNGATSGNHGYDSGTQYTYEMTLTRNGAGGLDVLSTMTGGTLNGSGTATVSYTDATASQGFSFDTFALRPNAPGTTATQFDTSLLRIEFTQVPEPSSVALAGLALALAAWRRRHS
jgi:hypothetical protein